MGGDESQAGSSSIVYDYVGHSILCELNLPGSGTGHTLTHTIQRTWTFWRTRERRQSFTMEGKLVPAEACKQVH